MCEAYFGKSNVVQYCKHHPCNAASFYFILLIGAYFMCVGLLVARQMKMSTLIPHAPLNCLVNDPKVLHIREPARKAVLCAAQFVVGLSSSIGNITSHFFHLGIVVETWCSFANMCRKLQMVSR
jgi:hypothetical protein